LEKPLPADHSFKVGDAVGIAHMYRPRRGSCNPYWPGRVILCYPKVYVEEAAQGDRLDVMNGKADWC